MIRELLSFGDEEGGEESTCDHDIEVDDVEEREQYTGFVFSKDHDMVLFRKETYEVLHGVGCAKCDWGYDIATHEGSRVIEYVDAFGEYVTDSVERQQPEPVVSIVTDDKEVSVITENARCNVE